MLIQRSDQTRALDISIDLLIQAPASRHPQHAADSLHAWQVTRSPKTAVSFARLVLPLLSRLPAEQVVPLLPDEGSIKNWLKLSGNQVESVATKVLAEPPLYLATAAWDWLLHLTRSPAHRPALLHTVGCLRGGEHSKAAEAKLNAYLSKDSKGRHLEGILAACVDDSQSINSLARWVSANPKIMESALNAIPHIAGMKSPDVPLGQFVQEVFAGLLNTSGRKRLRTCAWLARLGANLVLVEKRSPSGEAALSRVTALGQELRLTARTPEDQSATWILSPFTSKTGETDELLSAEGARRWAFAFEESRSANQPTEMLSGLGYNLGLRPVSTVGETVVFDPRWHEDIIGGLLPGSSAQVTHSGWKYQDVPLIRTKVQPL